MDSLGRPVGLVLGDDVLLLYPFAELVAVAQELLQLEQVAQALHEGDGAVAVGQAALVDGVGAFGDLVAGKVALLAEALRELDDAVDLVVVRLHRGEEGLVTLQQILGLLQVGGGFVLAQRMLQKKLTLHLDTSFKR